RARGVLYALLSGLAEPAGALLAFAFFARFITPLFLNGLVASIAGIMLYVSFSELLGEGFSYGKNGFTTAGLVLGTLVMDVGIYLV
ncbi:MAG: zinc transporter ZupT, partial [Ruthenibacterium sp.]